MWMFPSTALLVSAMLFLCADLQAQSGIVVSGGTASGTDGSVSSSSGQIVYSTFKGSTGTLTEGIQQPVEILVSGIAPSIHSDVVANLYPNPASSVVTLRIDDRPNEPLTYRLYSPLGELCLQEDITDSETRISLLDLPNGVYLIEIRDEDILIRTFTLVKNY